MMRILRAIFSGMMRTGYVNVRNNLDERTIECLLTTPEKGSHRPGEKMTMRLCNSEKLVDEGMMTTTTIMKQGGIIITLVQKGNISSSSIVNDLPGIVLRHPGSRVMILIVNFHMMILINSRDDTLREALEDAVLIMSVKNIFVTFHNIPTTCKMDMSIVDRFQNRTETITMTILVTNQVSDMNHHRINMIHGMTTHEKEKKDNTGRQVKLSKTNRLAWKG
jgi:hypothetical protein